MSERLPPYDHAAEQSVIGSIYRHNELLGDVLPFVKAEDFYLHAHQLLLTAIVSLVESGQPADPVTLCNYFHERKQTVDIGGNAYLVTLWDAAPSGGNAVYYAKIVRKFSKLRALIHLTQEIQSEAYDIADPDELIALAEEKIFQLSAARTENRIVDWKKMTADSMARIDRRSNRADGEIGDEGIRTPWKRFNRITGGIYKGELTVIAARPSVGKTMTALGFINAACRDGNRVFFSSLEQGYIDIADRMLSQISGVDSRKFRVGMNTMDASEVVRAVSETDDFKLHVDDSAEQTVGAIASNARRLKARLGLDMVVVDYLGLVKSARARGVTRAEEVGVMTHALRAIAKTLQVSMVLLVQLNRGADTEKPRLSHLRESGDIEQDADTVVMLHRPQEKDDDQDNEPIDVIIAKQRNGPCETIHMIHEKKTYRLYEVEPTN